MRPLDPLETDAVVCGSSLLDHRRRIESLAIIDIAGFITDLKDHATHHGFHVHDERHFVETYSMRQAFEVDLHPEHACGGPLDLHHRSKSIRA